MGSKLRKIGVRAAIVMLTTSGMTAVTVGSVLATASPASAACSHAWQDRDSSSETVVNPVAGYSGIAMRNGPWEFCDLVVRVPWGQWTLMDCYASGGTPVNGVSTWSHVKWGNGGPLYEGWINDYYLSNRGSNFSC